nr:competence type IV pilus major pilin ComGC [Salisediminibacterium selenitireducens]
MKILKNKKGFTLIEMMIVLVVISILLLALIPNMTKNQSVAADKGCEATVEMVQAQVMAFKVDTGSFPADLAKLQDGEYVEHITCQNGQTLNLDTVTGKVSLNQSE